MFYFCFFAPIQKKHVSLQLQTKTMNNIDINARLLFLNIKKRDVYCLF